MSISGSSTDLTGSDLFLNYLTTPEILKEGRNIISLSGEDHLGNSISRSLTAWAGSATIKVLTDDESTVDLTVEVDEGGTPYYLTVTRETTDSVIYFYNVPQLPATISTVVTPNFRMSRKINIVGDATVDLRSKRK